MNLPLFFILFLFIPGFLIFRKYRRNHQLAFIKNYSFHKSIRSKVVKAYPHLTDEQTHLVFQALRDYFWMCNMGKRKMVAMPSQVVDVAWHEFILFTRSYKSFCQKSLGRFLHHTPTEAMSAPTLAQEGIKRAWRFACAKEGINPTTPLILPLIFSIDTLLEIPDGFKYSLNCQEKTSLTQGDGYCAGHIGCSSGCAGDSGIETTDSGGGFFDGFFDSNCASNCGGGCGGD